MQLQEERRDRDYLYGRLLAVADKLEKTALYHSGNSNSRATNAVRLMSNYSVKPCATWGILWAQLIPYKAQLNGAGYYQEIIDDIMCLFEEGDFESNKPLSPMHLLGYSAQNRAFKNKNKEEKEN